ncbi:MAG: NAD(P)/FAD-dependent oxidoreductase [Chloroflexota bacterium]
MPQTDILIIGGSSSGLSVAGALAQYGIQPTILDADAQSGDVWRKRYDRLHLHTIKGLSHSAYKKLPDALPRYVPKDAFADYLTRYANELNADIHYNTRVTRVAKSQSAPYRYRVETESGDIWEARHCVIATGINRTPFIPDWQGINSFNGRLMHACEHKTGKEFAGKRVLVVGIGNSGAEISADCAEQGTSVVHSSIRTFPMIVKRDPFGIPVHVWGVILFSFPTSFKDWVVNSLAKVEIGDLSRYGIQKPAWNVFGDKRIPMIDVGYVDQLKAGNISVKPDIACFTPEGVEFTDGEQVAYDVVIAATGYRTGLEKIMDISGVIDEDGTVTEPNGAPTSHAGLWFVGLVNSPAGVLMAARIQARNIAKAIAEAEGIAV